MLSRSSLLCAPIVLVFLIAFDVTDAAAWGRRGHEIVNQLAQASLPPDVPAFLRTGMAHDEFGYLGPEPDRWGSSTEPELKIAQEPDHFLSMEWSDLIGNMPRNRYDYVRALAVAQLKYPAMTLKAEDVGTQPYQTNELWQRLKVAMRQYRRLTQANQDTTAVQGEIIFLAGWMGHYVGDGSQPLHLTYRYNGWIGDNPDGYTVSRKIHGQFESVFISDNINESNVTPYIAPKAVVMEDVFNDYLVYLHHTRDLYVQVYKFEKAGALTGSGTAESRSFAAQRLAAGATELRDLIYTAWIRSAEPLPASR